MNAFATIIELVELTALIVLLVYLIRILRDKDVTEPRSAIIDRNLAELADFNRLVAGNPDLTRIWQDGRTDRRLNDIDEERFSLLASDYLTILSNQHQRAAAVEDAELAEAATGKLIENLQFNPGLISIWEEIADSVACAELREIVSRAMQADEPESAAGPDTADIAAAPEASQTVAAEESTATTDEASEEVPAAATVAMAEESTGNDEATADAPPRTEQAASGEKTPTPVLAMQEAGSEARQETEPGESDAEDSAPARSAVLKQVAAAEEQTDSGSLDAMPAKAS